MFFACGKDVNNLWPEGELWQIKSAYKFLPHLSIGGVVYYFSSWMWLNLGLYLTNRMRRKWFCLNLKYLALKRSSVPDFVHWEYFVFQHDERSPNHTERPHGGELRWSVWQPQRSSSLTHQHELPVMKGSNVGCSNLSKLGKTAAEASSWTQSTYRLLRDNKWFLLQATELGVFGYIVTEDQNIYLLSAHYVPDTVLEILHSLLH